MLRDDRLSVVAMVGLCLLAIALAFMCSCGSVERVVPLPKTPMEEKVEAIAKERDEAVKTSADAKEAAKKARAEADAARKLADEKDKEAQHYEGLARTLRNQEIASRIAIWSWILAAAGAVGVLVGGWLCLRFPSKTSVTIAVTGAIALGLGLVGVWLAPHWITVAWAFAILVVLALAGGMAYLLHDHQTALRDVWDKTEDEIKKDPRLAKMLKKAKAKDIV